MKLDRGTFDTLPLSLITTSTVESLAALLGTDLNVLRFRPNLVIEAFGDAAFPEDEWVGRDLTVGTTWMRIDRRDKRCVVVNIDPVTGRRDPTVLSAIAAHRDTCLGVYGSTIRPGGWPSVTPWFCGPERPPTRRHLGLARQLRGTAPDRPMHQMGMLAHELPVRGTRCPA